MKNCKHDVLTVKISYQENYLIRFENWLVTSFSLDSEEEHCYSITCSRCGYEVFVASAPPREIKNPKITRAIADFERQIKAMVDLDTFVAELSGGPHDAGDEEDWQK